MLLGLIFREKAKYKRSLREWRAEKKEGGELPVHRPTNSTSFSTIQPSFLNRTYTGTTVDANEFGYSKSQEAGSHAGYGFGRQAEKAAEARGFSVEKPDETLPRYAPRPVPQTQHNLSSRFSAPTATHNDDDEEHEQHHQTRSAGDLRDDGEETAEEEDTGDEEEDEEEGTVESTHVHFANPALKMPEPNVEPAHFLAQAEQIMALPQMQNHGIKPLFLSSKTSL